MKFLAVILLLMAFIFPGYVNATVLVMTADFQKTGDIGVYGGTMFDTTSTCPAISSVTGWYDETSFSVWTGVGSPTWPYPHHHQYADGYYTFATTPLNGKTIESAFFKVCVIDLYADTLTYSSDLQFRFQADCVTQFMVDADTACFCVGGCTPDTVVSYAAFSIGDTLTIRVPEAAINKAGDTNIIVRSSRQKDYCVLHDEQYVTLSSTAESEGYDDDPYLLVTYTEGECACCND
jgi:hypothetical protein